MDEATVRTWVDGYVKAWGTNDPEDITALFSEGARYYTAPHREPWNGQANIVAGWLERKEQPGEWTFRYEILGIDGDTAFVRGWTGYTDDSDYSNLWVITLDGDGRASEFIEWWMADDAG